MGTEATLCKGLEPRMAARPGGCLCCTGLKRAGSRFAHGRYDKGDPVFQPEFHQLDSTILAVSNSR